MADGLPWIRYDTDTFNNLKILQLVQEKRWQSLVVWHFALGYSGGQGLEGYVPAIALPQIHGTKRNANDLVRVGLWKEAPGGWDINGWHDKQPTAQEAAARRDKAIKAARARWDKAKAHERGESAELARLRIAELEDDAPSIAREQC